MRARELKEQNINLTDNEKQWVNPEKNQIVVVPSVTHHTKFAYENPQKLGLSGNLFKDYEYPINDEGKSFMIDNNIIKVMFDAGWARTSTYPIDERNVDIHCLNLKIAAKTLRLLKQKFNDITSVILDIGLDIYSAKSYTLRDNTFKTFFRTGKIVKPSSMAQFRENLKARNVIGSAVRVDEIPKKYREKYTMIGRGATSLVYEMDKDWVLVFTRDKMKEEWLGTMGLELGDTIDELEVRGIHRIRGMSDIPIYVIKMPRLYDLNAENKKLVRTEIEQFTHKWNELRAKYPHQQEILALHDLYNYYSEHYESSLLYPLISFVSNYDSSQFIFDLLQRNFMQDSQGDIVLVDPIVDKSVYDLIMDSKK